MTDDAATDRLFTAEELAAGVHRERVGGAWDAIGELQLSFLRVRGLRPDMKLLDMGCGCLRAGVRLAAYLDSGNYFGIDASAALLAAGFEVELPRYGLAGRVPRDHLLHDETFAAHRFGVTFDVAIACSLFTHLPASAVRRCLHELAAVIRPGGELFATYFGCPEMDPPPLAWRQEPGGVVTYLDRDPYHRTFADLAACADGLAWRSEDIGAWGHPVGQRMARFERLPG